MIRFVCCDITLRSRDERCLTGIIVPATPALFLFLLATYHWIFNYCSPAAIVPQEKLIRFSFNSILHENQHNRAAACDYSIVAVGGESAADAIKYFLCM